MVIFMIVFRSGNHTQMCRESTTGISWMHEAHCSRVTDSVHSGDCLKHIRHVGTSAFCSRLYSKPLVCQHILMARHVECVASSMTQAVE